MPPKSAIAIIEVTILDTDDKDPIFTKTSYNGYISHNSPPVRHLIQMNNKKYASFYSLGDFCKYERRNYCV